MLKNLVDYIMALKCINSSTLRLKIRTKLGEVRVQSGNVLRQSCKRCDLVIDLRAQVVQLRSLYFKLVGCEAEISPELSNN